MISKKEVQHITKLARLGITKKEEEKFAGELSSILDYVEQLKKIDVSKVNPTSHPFKIENVLRKDEAKTLDPKETPRRVASQKLLDLAPETKDGYLKVKSIL